MLDTAPSSVPTRGGRSRRTLHLAQALDSEVGASLGASASANSAEAPLEADDAPDAAGATSTDGESMYSGAAPSLPRP